MDSDDSGNHHDNTAAGLPSRKAHDATGLRPSRTTGWWLPFTLLPSHPSHPLSLPAPFLSPRLPSLPCFLLLPALPRLVASSRAGFQELSIRKGLIKRCAWPRKVRKKAEPVKKPTPLLDLQKLQEDLDACGYIAAWTTLRAASDVAQQLLERVLLVLYLLQRIMPAGRCNV